MERQSRAVVCLWVVSMTALAVACENTKAEQAEIDGKFDNLTQPSSSDLCGSPGGRITYQIKRIDGCRGGATLYIDDKEVPATWKQDPQDGIVIFTNLPPDIAEGKHEISGACLKADVDGAPYAGQVGGGRRPFTVPCAPDAGPDATVDDAGPDVNDSGVDATPDGEADATLQDSDVDANDASSVDASTEDAEPDVVTDATPDAVTDAGADVVDAADACSEEICDGIDNDCDGKIDDGCPISFSGIDYVDVSPTWGYTGTTPVYNGTGFSALCAYPAAMVSVCGRFTGTAITGLGYKCSNFTMAKNTTVVPYAYSITTAVAANCANTDMAGMTSGGTTFNHKCESGSVVHAISGAYGDTATDKITQIKVECVKLDLTRASGNVWSVVKGATVSSTDYGPGGGGKTFNWVAPNTATGKPSFLRGFSGRYGNPDGLYQLSTSARSFNLLVE